MAQITQYNTLSQITQITPSEYTLYWKFFHHSGCLSNLRLPWRTVFALKIFTVLNIFFTIQGFWATLRLPWKRVALKFFTVLNIYCLSFRTFEKLALALKTEFALIFLAHLNIAYFLHSGFFSNLRLPWKTQCALKFFTVLKYFVPF